MSILLVAAEPREFRGVLRRATRARKLVSAAQWARSVRLGAAELVLAANGAGAERAAAAVNAFPDARAVVSTGFCGAADPALRVGDIFVASEVEGLGRLFRTCLPASSAAAFRGRLATLPRVARTAAEKAALRESGASAVDMEAAGAARAAEARGLPFFCVRAVTDLADEDLHNDFDAAMRGDGHFDTMHLLRAAASNPALLLPELVRMGRRSCVAARALGGFIADCRF
ncbi:MAG: hypothetical protein ACE15B_11585 [Bryobacteraceae bacterium]